MLQGVSSASEYANEQNRARSLWQYSISIFLHTPADFDVLAV